MATQLQIARKRYAERFGLSEYRAARHTVGLDAVSVDAMVEDATYVPPYRPKLPDRPPVSAEVIALLDRWRQANQGKPATMPWLYSIRERGRLDFHLDRARAWSTTQS